MVHIIQGMQVMLIIIDEVNGWKSEISLKSGLVDGLEVHLAGILQFHLTLVLGNVMRLIIKIEELV